MTLEEIIQAAGKTNVEIIRESRLLFMAKGLKVVDAMLMGKGEKQHLKIILHNNNYY